MKRLYNAHELRVALNGCSRWKRALQIYLLLSRAPLEVEIVGERRVQGEHVQHVLLVESVVGEDLGAFAVPARHLENIVKSLGSVAFLGLLLARVGLDDPANPRVKRPLLRDLFGLVHSADTHEVEGVERIRYGHIDRVRRGRDGELLDLGPDGVDAVHCARDGERGLERADVNAVGAAGVGGAYGVPVTGGVVGGHARGAVRVHQGAAHGNGVQSLRRRLRDVVLEHADLARGVGAHGLGLKERALPLGADAHEAGRERREPAQENSVRVVVDVRNGGLELQRVLDAHERRVGETQLQDVVHGEHELLLGRLVDFFDGERVRALASDLLALPGLRAREQRVDMLPAVAQRRVVPKLAHEMAPGRLFVVVGHGLRHQAGERGRLATQRRDRPQRVEGVLGLLGRQARVEAGKSASAGEAARDEHGGKQKVKNV
ncbi:hypothetical protein EXIGLDRAFT_515143 [Exidia glandulosa HHB12029]|uniref:Uncharacterized protein n=1 Tax=Exidia glandulosa HHB12029 TaxID=1314781 RepID=A0A165J8P2_EXIGL|nr:hypothetical protein EXIGLDRAFT_515143 [Exidia glandulosa HHB12029]